MTDLATKKMWRTIGFLITDEVNEILVCFIDEKMNAVKKTLKLPHFNKGRVQTNARSTRSSFYQTPPAFHRGNTVLVLIVCNGS